MPLLTVQLALFVAAAFVIGCVLGRVLRRAKPAASGEERMIVAAAHAAPPAGETPEPLGPAAPETPEPPAVKTVPDAEVVGGPLPAAEPACEAEDAERDRPPFLEAPRGGRADDLTAIAGIGRAVEAMLNERGIFHYAQIAQWTPEESAWIELSIGFPRRVGREDWIGQASAKISVKAAPARRAKTRKSAPKSKAKA